jgi:hypothetical protein
MRKTDVSFGAGEGLRGRRRTLARSSPNGAQVKVEVASDPGKSVVRGDLGQQSPSRRIILT